MAWVRVGDETVATYLSRNGLNGGGERVKIGLWLREVSPSAGVLLSGVKSVTIHVEEVEIPEGGGLKPIKELGDFVVPVSRTKEGATLRDGEPKGSREASRQDLRSMPAAPTQLPDPPRIEGGVLKMSWPVTPDQDARSIAQDLSVLATSYASEVPDALSMEASLQFILDGGELYQGGFASVSLASMRTNPMYAETIADNLVAQVHQLLERKASFESAR